MARHLVSPPLCPLSVTFVCHRHRFRHLTPLRRRRCLPNLDRLCRVRDPGLGGGATTGRMLEIGMKGEVKMERREDGRENQLRHRANLPKTYSQRCHTDVVIVGGSRMCQPGTRRVHTASYRWGPICEDLLLQEHPL